MVTVKVEGHDNLIRKLRGFRSRTAGPTRRMFERIVRGVRGQVIEFSPVDTGLLRSSWGVEIAESGGFPTWGAVANPVSYAEPLERNTRNARPRGVGRIPFLGPAIRRFNRSHMSKVLRIWAKEIEDAMVKN